MSKASAPPQLPLVASGLLLGLILALLPWGQAWAQVDTSLVNVGPPSGTITLGNPNVTVPVTIARGDTLPAIMAFSIQFSASSPLSLPAGRFSITLPPDGGFLNAAGDRSVSLQTIDLGGGAYQADGITMGSPCGSNALSGTLFNIEITSGATGGAGTVALTSVIIRDCLNDPLVSETGGAANVLVDRSAPSVSVVSPNGGETWYVGESKQIRWNGSDAEGVDSYDVAYSTTGGAPYTTLATGLAGTDTSYAWTIPAAASSTVKVQVTAHDVNGNAAADTSDADFTIGYHTITASAGANGTIAPSGAVPVAHGASQSFTITPADNHHVADVLVDSVSVGAVTGYEFTNVTEDHTIEASFAIDTHTITATAGAHGSIEPSGEVGVDHGASRSFAIAPDPCYHVADVLVDSVSVGAVESYEFTNVTEDHTIEASFAIDIFTITATAGANGSITPSGAVPVDCGSNRSFDIAADPGYHIADVLVDSVSVGAVTDYEFTNVTEDHTIEASFAVNPPVAAIADLAAAQVLTGNPPGVTTGIGLNWTATAPGTTVEVWRHGFGHYPEYDDAGGAAPAASETYPPGGDWALTGVTDPLDIDAPGTRDFYYYVAYVQDAYGTWSPKSNMTAGTLNYHLGDVSDDVTPGTGNNNVSTEDVSLLGSHYGITLAPDDPYNYLDAGPTTNMWVDGLPTTDNLVAFEDLVMFAVNYHAVSAAKPPAPSAATANELVAEAPERAEGATIDVRLRVRSTGALMALSAKLAWDPAVVEPAGLVVGDWLTEQGGVAFSAEPGAVDAAALRSTGLSGEGLLAAIAFRVLASGDPKIGVESLEGRDARNHPLPVGSSLAPAPRPVPIVTRLESAAPNPFRRTATIAYSLSAGGPVQLAIYSVDGRRVRTLVEGAREAGEYRATWDGRDDEGRAAAAGVYYARLVTAQGRFTRTIAYLK